MAKPILMAAICVAFAAAAASARTVQRPASPTPPTVQSPAPPPSPQRPERAEPRDVDRPVLSDALPRTDPLCLGEAEIERYVQRTCTDGETVTEHIRCTQAGQGGLFPNCSYVERCEPVDDSPSCETPRTDR